MAERLVSPETLTMVHALVDRADALDDAVEAFRTAYPDAPSQLIEAATHHVFCDGIGAALDWVAAAERFLRNPKARFDYGATSHAIYHLYNWLQIEALLPTGREGVLELLSDIRTFIAEEDTDAAVSVIGRLEELFQGSVSPPQIG